ncbi:MAG: VWA domain-containing protein, partial [Acidobacteria bacterium]|nr:VWA domain-containing protein [Acidobacteriota bacterium]
MTRRELLVCLCAFPAFAQDTTIRVTTRLVQVSVLVLDNKGRPVEGLAKDDFVLLDKGKEQKIAEFAVESRNRKNSPPRLQPGLFTNYWEIAPRGMTPNATIILFDALNTSFADQAYARRQMLKCLESLQGGDRIAIYSLSRNLRVLHEFTDDTTALIRAVSRLKGHVSPELQASTEQPEPVGDERIDEFLEESNRRITDYYTINRVKTTLAAMEGIAYHVARLPGRKNLIWISGSFPAWIGMDEPPMSATGRVFTGERRTFSDEIEHAVRLLNNSNIAIYPVDARGLIPDPTFSAVSKGSANPRTAGRKSPMQSIALTHDTMHMLADRTGGRPFYNSNDIAGALRKTLDES